MKSSKFVKYAVLLAVVGLGGQVSLAGVPLNNLEGVGDVAFNPLAYPAGQNKDANSTGVLSKPQFGAWYVNLGDLDVDWTAIGAAETLFNRLEVSYGYEVVSPSSKNIKKNNVCGVVLSAQYAF